MSFTATPCQTVGYAYPLENVLYYDFVTNYATAPNSSAYNFGINDPFSIEAWFSVGPLDSTHINAQQAIISKAVDITLRGWFLTLYGDNNPTSEVKRQLGFRICDTNGVNQLFVGWQGKFPNDINSIRHVIITVDGSNSTDGIKGYIDGVNEPFDVVGTLGTNVNITNSNTLGLGIWKQNVLIDKNYNGYFQGNLYMARIYDKELTAEEANHCFTCKKPPEYTRNNLAGEWLVTEIAPSTVADTSGNGNDATTVGFVASDFLNSVTGEQASNEATC